MRTAQGLVIAWGMTVLVADVSTRRIPNLLSIGAAGLALAYLIVNGEAVLGAAWLSVLLGAGLALGLTLPAYLVGQLGAGDVKLLFAIGLLGGWQVALASFAVAGLVAAAAIAGWLVMVRYRGYVQPSKRFFPFGAMLALGLLVALELVP